MRGPARRLAARLAALLGAAGAACAPQADTRLALSASASSVPADGLSRIHVSADLGGAAQATVLQLELAGPGLLSSTQVPVSAGRAEVDVYAPFEAELSAGDVASTLTARAQVDELAISGSVSLGFTVPTTGAPLLSARPVPDRVRAGSAEPMVLLIDGRRLTDGVVTLSADPPLPELPATLELQQNGAAFHAEIEIPAPAEPTTVRVEIAGGGAAPVEAVLHFIGEDDAAFDVSGTFAQVSYSVMKIGGLFFLDPDPQCLVAPTLSLLRQTQDGSVVSLETEVCDIQIPTVNLVWPLGASRTWVDPSFIAAINRRAGAPLVATLAGDGTLTPDAASLNVKGTLGVELGDDEALPTDGADPRVVDHDGDGHPGVTIHNDKQGDQYTASRQWTTELLAAATSSDAVDGTQDGESESSVFNGGDGGLAPTIENFPSAWHARRVDGRNGSVNIALRDGDGASISCADVKAYAAELLAAAPGPDPERACQ